MSELLGVVKGLVSTRTVLMAVLVCGLAGTPARAAVMPSDALTELNTWRNEFREAPVASIVPSWNTACQHHNNYEDVNGMTLTHNESSGNPGYTADGAVAGPDSVLALAVSTHLHL